MGWGVVPWGTEVPHLPTPTPDPSPQGGGEEHEATSNLNLAPRSATLVYALPQSVNTYTMEHVLAYFSAAGLVPPVQCGPAAMAMYCLPLTA